MEPEDVARGKSIATGVHRDHRAGWRSVIQCRISLPGVGYCQKQVTKWWSDGTPLEKMQRWRVEEKPRITAALQEKVDAPLRELEALKKEVAQLRTPAPAIKGRSYWTLAERLTEAEQQLVEQAATIQRLQQAVAAAERRAEASEASARRAYAGFAAAGARR